MEYLAQFSFTHSISLVLFIYFGIFQPIIINFLKDIEYLNSLFDHTQTLEKIFNYNTYLIKIVKLFPTNFIKLSEIIY